jgi:hypothetical protein
MGTFPVLTTPPSDVDLSPESLEEITAPLSEDEFVPLLQGETATTCLSLSLQQAQSYVGFFFGDTPRRDATHNRLSATSQQIVIPVEDMCVNCDG